MRGATRAAAWLAAPLIAILCAAGASAVERNGVTVDVIAEPPAFFPSSTERTAYGAYRITVINGTPSALNNYRFRATLTTPGAEFTESNPVQQDTANCSRPSLNEIDCAVGYNGLIDKGQTVSFNVQIKNPTRDQAAPTYMVQLAWDVRPGDGGSLGYISGTTATPLSDKDPTGDNAQVESVVPPAGYFIYTGTNNTPKGNDRHTTASNIVPSPNTLILASIVEGTAEQSNGACLSTNAKYCSQLSVLTGSGAKAKYNPNDPATSTLSDKLTIILRVDAAATTAIGTNINQAQIWYVPDDPADTTGPRFLMDCPKPNRSSYVPTTDFSPCIHSRTVISKKFGVDLVGDWEFVIFALGNGRFEFF